MWGRSAATSTQWHAPIRSSAQRWTRSSCSRRTCTDTSTTLGSRSGTSRLGAGRDLPGEQIDACRARGIRTYVHYCTTWDNHLAENHPEWLYTTKDRRSYLPRSDETPAWTALCLGNEGFVTLMLDHSREILERYRPDGIWYYMPMTNLDGEFT
ncbi:hypothetical protein GLO27_19240 [Microbacterium sp. Be9]|nr:hypothetical protein [Microbacterium sp. Be9]